MKGFISLLEFSSEELIEILDRADRLYELWQNSEMPQSLKNNKIGLWFWGQGFRNRVAFEIGAKSMGAITSYIPGELGIQEPLEDVGNYLKNWFDFLIIRAKSHEDLIYLKTYLDIPIINARTNLSHPCEIMGDFQFIRKYRGTLENLNMVFVGEVTNICMSWFEAAVKFPINIIQIAPIDYQASKILIDDLNKYAKGNISVSDNMNLINEKIDLIYTDCWPNTDNIRSKNKIKELFLPYQIKNEHLLRINKKGIFLPCPPVTRGEEVSIDAMKSELCLNYKSKEFLLHSQNAIMEIVKTFAQQNFA